MVKRDHEEDLDNEFLMLTKPKKKKTETTTLVLDEEDVTEADFEDGYDSDLMGDEKDVQELNAMTELEREEIIMERYEKREELKRLREEAIKSGKLKPETFPQKKTNKRSSALSDIRAKREAKRQEPTKKKSSLYDEERTTSSTTTTQNQYHRERREEETISYEDIQKITLSRRRLEKWVNEPFFEKTVLNCFVRVSIGENNGIRVYRFCEIFALKEKSLYQLEKKSTSTHLILKQGGKEKSFPISVVSNSNFTLSEFNSWLKSAKESHDYIPTQEDIKKKMEAFEKAAEYSYTEEDISKLLEEKKKLGKQIPGQNLAVEKLKLCTLRDEYLDEGKMEEYKDMCKQIEEIEETIRKRDSNKNKVSIDITKITRNLPTPQATLIQSSNSISSKVLEALNDDEDENGLKKNKDKYDAFSRRPTRSTGMFVEDSPKNTQSSNASPRGLMSPTDSPASVLQKAHDFELVLDFDNLQKKNTQKSTSVTQTKTNQSETKKSLSIAEYKRRKGI